jgi:hypothetical protein
MPSGAGTSPSFIHIHPSPSTVAGFAFARAKGSRVSQDFLTKIYAVGILGVQSRLSFLKYLASNKLFTDKSIPRLFFAVPDSTLVLRQSFNFDVVLT